MIKSCLIKPYTYTEILRYLNKVLQFHAVSYMNTILTDSRLKFHPKKILCEIFGQDHHEILTDNVPISYTHGRFI